VRLSIVLAVALSGCSCDGDERLLVEIARAQSEGESELFIRAARDFIEKYPSHPERDRVRYDLASELVAQNITTPDTLAAEEARRLLEAQAREAKTDAERFDAALLRAKFSPKEDTLVMARELLAKFTSEEQAKQIYFWAIADLSQNGRVRPAAELARALLDRAPNVENAGRYRRVIRRAELPGKIAPFDERERARLGRALEKPVVLVDFWASWCAPCIAEIPKLREVNERLAPRGLSLVGVSVDHEQAYQSFIADHPPAWTVIRAESDEILDRFGIDALPAYVLLDGEGRVLETELSGEPLYQKIDQLLR
jgi:thiol-disulfide isomerase/thioredoxin